MLIAPTQSATPMPKQVNRRIYFHTIIAGHAYETTPGASTRDVVGIA
jgi:hypothetical protein